MRSGKVGDNAYNQFKSDIDNLPTKKFIFNKTTNPDKHSDKSMLQSVMIAFGFRKDIVEENTIEDVQTILKDRINQKLKVSIDDSGHILDRLLRKSKVKKNQLNETAVVKKIMNLIENLDTFGSAPLFDEVNRDFVPNEDAKNLIKYIFSGQPLSSKIVSTNIAKGLLLSKNEQLLKDVRIELQGYLDRLGTQLNEQAYKTPDHQKQAEVLIGNILALYPFFEPENGSELQLPQKIDGKWVMVNYKIDLLQMTPTWKGDPYYACGLKPTNNSKANAHLLFMGTPPPTTRGVAHAEFTDFVPCHAVGETIYNEGKKVIEDWTQEVVKKTGKKVNVYGQSLGGGLAQILISHRPELIGKVFAYNPPSLSTPLLNQYQEKVKELAVADRPEVNIYCQENDPVYSIGAGWDPKWNVYQVIPERSPNFYEAHIGAFSGQKKVVVIKLKEDDIKAHNVSSARRIYSFFTDCMKVPLFIAKGLALGVQIVKHNLSGRAQVAVT